MSTLSFLEEEREIDKAEKKLIRKQQGRKNLLLVFLQIAGPIFWTMVVVASVVAVKSLLFYSAITENLQVEIILKTMAIIITLFVAVTIYTTIKESEIWRRIKMFITSLRFYEEKPW